MIGPNVIQAIIDDTGNNWKGFPFLFSICTAASLVIWFGEPGFRFRRLLVSNAVSQGVDVNTGRRDAVAWAEKNRRYIDTGILGEDKSESVDDGASGKRV